MLEQVPVTEFGGQAVPLKELASIRLEETPPTSSTKIFGVGRLFRPRTSRDVASFVTEAQTTVKEKVSLPAGYEVRWGGEFENLHVSEFAVSDYHADRALIIMLLLHTSLGSLRLACLIFLAVPMAASGGIIALYCAKCHSASQQVLASSLSLGRGLERFGLGECCRRPSCGWFAARSSLYRNGADAFASRINDSFGGQPRFMPMALSTGDGAEMQRPLATVVIGGSLLQRY